MLQQKHTAVAKQKTSNTQNNNNTLDSKNKKNNTKTQNSKDKYKALKQQSANEIMPPPQT